MFFHSNELLSPKVLDLDQRVAEEGGVLFQVPEASFKATVVAKFVIGDFLGWG